MKISAMLGAFLLFFATGFGPALIFTASSYKRRILVSMALAPVLGFIVIAFFLYILYLLRLPIRQSALPSTIGGVILSAVLVIFDWRFRPVDYKNIIYGISRLKLLIISIAWCVVVTIVLLIPVIGGAKYQYYQGNVYDATNYVLIAIFSRDFPIDYVSNSTHYDEILNHNPSVFPMAEHGIANMRPSVSHLLAWQSVLFNQPPISIFYFEKLLSLLITAALAAALAYQLGFKGWQQISLMLVSAVGFWVVFVFDIDALSQIFSIPLSLLFIFAFVQFEREGRSLVFSRHRWFLAFTAAALLCFYPEITLPLIPVFVIYYGLEVLLNPCRSVLKSIGWHLLTVILIMLLLNIMLFPTLKFMQNQSQIALSGETTKWASGYFSWLFYQRDPFFSLWGLRNLTSEGNGKISREVLKAALLMAMFVVVATIIGSGILKSLTRRLNHPETRLLALLIIVYWGGGILLYLIGNDWVAGKMLAMGAPFMVLGVFVFFRDYFSDPSFLNRLLQIGLVIWVIVQILTLPLRLLTIETGLQIPNTVQFMQPVFPEVIEPVVKRLKAENTTLIGLDLGDSKPPLIYTFALSISDLATVIFNDSVPSYYDVLLLPERWITTESIPDHIIVIDGRDYLKPLGIGQSLITVSADSLATGIQYVTAYAVKPDDYDQALYRADILTPDVPSAPIVRGLDAAFIPQSGASFIRWMVNNSSEVHFISSHSQPLGVYLESSAAYDGNMIIDFNGTPVGQVLMKENVQTQSNGLCLTTKGGTNVLKFLHPKLNTTNINRVLIHKLLFAPVDMLDVGAVSDTRQIGTGWQAQENWGEETVRWAEKDALLQIMSCETTGGRKLHFRAFVPPDAGSQSVTVQLNGIETGMIELSPGWKEYTLQVADSSLQTTGLQTIELHHAHTFVPSNDTRMLSAAYDRFWLTNN